MNTITNLFSTKHLLILGLGLLMVGCRPPKDFSDTPTLEYTTSIQYKEDRQGTFADIIEVELYFTDGDGDIGLDEGDTSSPDFCSSCPYYNNLLGEIYVEENGVKEFYSTYNARIKNLTPTGQNKTLEGQLFFQIDVTTRTSDSLHFTFQLLDRSLNKSEVAESGLIWVNL